MTTASQARRSSRGDLEGVEPAPGDAHHPGAPVAPGLRGDPGQHLLGVAQLLLEVLVGEHALGVAAAAQVDPDARVAVSREVGVVDRVPDRGEVALAVRDELQDGGDGLQVGGLRPPDPPGEAGAVRQRDAELGVLLDAMREPLRVDDPHPAGSSNSNGSPATSVLVLADQLVLVVGSEVDGGQRVAVAVLVVQLGQAVAHGDRDVDGAARDVALHPLDLLGGGHPARHTVGGAAHEPLGGDVVGALAGAVVAVRGRARAAACGRGWRRRRPARTARRATAECRGLTSSRVIVSWSGVPEVLDVEGDAVEADLPDDPRGELGHAVRHRRRERGGVLVAQEARAVSGR